jgi:tRNA(fMet)-specific endonuclease VapC
MTYLLDTNACIAALRGHQQVLEHLRQHTPSDFAVSTISLYELYSGVARCRQPAIERQKIDTFLHPLHLLPYDPDSAIQAAHLRWSLEKRGNLIGPYDLLRAGQALALNLILITNNTDEFHRAPKLLWEDWQTR